jgi:cell division protein FtsZ
LINLDFADVKTVMSGMGLAMMGTGVAEGEERAVEAARRAISSPLLEGASIMGARGVIINITGGPDLSLVEVSNASTIVQEAADEDANIIFGAVVDPALTGRIKITVIATGFGAFVSTARPGSSGHTPVDMSNYADVARLRDSGQTAGSPPLDRAGQRLSVARRPLIDLPTSVGGLGSSTSGFGNAGQPGTEAGDVEAGELNTHFDVPAFLRRHEG